MNSLLVSTQVTTGIALAQVGFRTAAFCFKQQIVERRRVPAIGRLLKSSLGTREQLSINLGSSAA